MTVSEAEAAAPASVEAAVPGAASRPYPPSWLNIVLDWLDRLPGPPFLAYAVLVVPSVILSNGALWASGLLPFGQLDPGQSFWGFYLPGLLAIVHYLNGVAREALIAFEPALGDDAEGAAAALYRLTVIPAAPALVILIVLAPLTLLYYVFDPTGSQIVGYTPVAIALRGVAEVLASAIILMFAYQTIRQLRLVDALHRMARNVDPFQPRPVYGFSRLTSQTGIALIVLIAAPAFVVQPAYESPNFWLLWAPWLISLPVVGVAIFVLPMLGMHQRLAREKERLEEAADGRLRDLLGELNVALDAHDTAGADGIQRLLAAHQAQREVLAHLPTWPWSGATLRGFASALVIPIVLFLIQRFLGDALGS